MKAPTIYLSFSGHCEEALNHYAKALGGTISLKTYYCDMPPSPDYPPVAEEHHDMIMHLTMELRDGTVMQGSDRAPGFGAPLQQGDNFSISIQADSNREADLIYSALAQDGTVTMPLQVTFWGAYFGTCRDKFGVNWMIACNADTPQS